MKKFAFILLTLALVACGGGNGPAVSSDVASQSSQSPQMLTLSFSKLEDIDPVTPGQQQSVRVVVSNFETDDPNLAKPRVKFEVEGVKIDFNWEGEELFFPELTPVFSEIGYNLEGEFDGDSFFADRITSNGNLVEIEISFYKDVKLPSP